MLMARRLAERGAGFITVTTDFVWDMHADANNATMTEGMGYVGRPFDHAVSAFIEDVEARGLRDKILLVCCGEMGRTPKINKRGGRDHWARAMFALMAGGDIRGGQVIGETDAKAAEPKNESVSPEDLAASFFKNIGIDPKMEFQANVGRLITLVRDGNPISQLF
mgnify:CR=1 FL=1